MEPEGRGRPRPSGFSACVRFMEGIASQAAGRRRLGSPVAGGGNLMPPTGAPGGIRAAERERGQNPSNGCQFCNRPHGERAIQPAPRFLYAGARLDRHLRMAWRRAQIPAVPDDPALRGRARRAALSQPSKRPLCSMGERKAWRARADSASPPENTQSRCTAAALGV